MIICIKHTIEFEMNNIKKNHFVDFYYIAKNQLAAIYYNLYSSTRFI